MRQFLVLSIICLILPWGSWWNVRTLDQERGQQVRPKMVPRLALVIGNGAYPSASLKNPINDADDMAQTLEKLGFEVLKGTNLPQREFLRLIATFGARLRGGGVGLFYFAGHGIQVGGENYMLPVDAQLETEADVDTYGINVNKVLKQIGSAGNQMNIVILDACRNNPYVNRNWRETTQGLAEVKAPSGTIIGYATAPGATANDGNGRNGLYTQELLAALPQMGIPIEQTFKMVLRQVREKSGGKQIPWISSALEGDFCFVENGPGNAGKTDPVTVELEFWDRIKNSSSRKDFDLYLAEYPAGLHAPLARLRLTELEPGGLPNSLKQITNRLGMEFVWIPSGTFRMGDDNHSPDEKPVHPVTLSHPFYLGKYEITQAQWRAVMGYNPSFFKGDNLPVEQVSWLEVQQFIQKLNDQGDGKYRLPTEAEWEYACQAGNQGNEGKVLDQAGWFAGNTGNTTHPVGQKAPNSWGLYDMQGNVWEWCQDVYGKYPTHPVTDPIGNEGKSLRVNRGGGLFSEIQYCQPTTRHFGKPDQRSLDLGFRLLKIAR
ncbi:MAG TPA: SUMF1/EgtB/PvdO family nonheme iron enzyme [Acidobacteriota bacterium]|nr:SUMF1/EgtB/PvdO family nonheme iron enzyme [Acidobacteriota bacterium]